MSDTVPNNNNVTIVQEYHAAYNAVIQPDKYVACSRYFIRRWMPELGGTGVQIVLALRSLGFHNPTTGETRNEIEINLLTLAEMIKVHPATIKREFLRNKALALFVAKDSNYRRDPVTGQVLRAANIYRVMMDDPLHDADLPKLQEILDAQEKVSHRKVQNAPNTKPDISRKAQNAIYSVQSAPNPAQTVQDSVQSAPCRAQNAPTLKDYSYTPKINKITEEHTAIAASDFSSLSLSQIAEKKEPEAEQEKPVPIPVPIPVPEKPVPIEWDSLGDKQKPFMLLAEKEVLDTYRALGKTPPYVVIENRAKTLYKVAIQKGVGVV